MRLEELQKEAVTNDMGKAETEDGFQRRRKARSTWKAFLWQKKNVICLAGGCAVLIGLFLFLGITIMSEKEDTISVSASKMFYSRKDVEELIAAAKEEEAQRILLGIQQNLESGMAATAALRPFYDDKIVLASSGRVRFFPIRDTLKKNHYSQDKLVKAENGELQYVQDGKVISHKGIDVSYHQGTIDWKQVASDGVEFAFIRVGIRGYGTGKLVLDEQFDNNVKGALANGIKVGVYFYSQSVNREEVLEEAKLTLEQILPYRITGPVVYDAEKVNDSRTSNLSQALRTDMAIAFCEAVKEAGYRPMVYVNLDTAFTMYEIERLEEYDKWVAHYGSEMYYPYDYKIWQYSDQGSVAGIAADVDLNISFEEWE